MRLLDGYDVGSNIDDLLAFGAEVSAIRVAGVVDLVDLERGI